MKFQYNKNIICYAKFPNINFKNDFMGETGRRSVEKIMDHNQRDKKLDVLIHARDGNHTIFLIIDFQLTSHMGSF